MDVLNLISSFAGIDTIDAVHEPVVVSSNLLPLTVINNLETSCWSVTDHFLGPKAAMEVFHVSITSTSNYHKSAMADS